MPPVSDRRALSPRGPILLLTLLVVLVVAGCRGPELGPGAQSSPRGSAADLSPGNPADPLPAPLPLPAGSPDEAAAGLAQRMLSGTPESLPALLAALQAAGVAVRGPDGHLAVQPANLGQGLAVSAWEARFMAALVGQGRTLLVPLTALQEVLVRAAPELRGIPIAQHILDGIRAHGQGPEGPMRAWARLIVELGRQRQVGGPQDLLGQVDPAEVRLDAVQLSLITVRLVGDLAALEGQAAAPRRDVVAEGGGRASGLEVARRVAGLGAWLAPGPAYAAQPCTEESPVVSRERVSAGGFDVLKGILRERVERSVLGRARRQVRHYNTLALVLAALRIDVAMDPPGPPLVRTRTTDPGEERTITARVSLDPTVLGTVECARALLAALGLRFNVDDPAGGGIAGIPLTWRLTAGQDVLFAQAGERGETDQHGSDTFAVLGQPQTRNLDANAKRVSKQAAVAVRFDLRPYTLLGGATPGPGGPLTPPEFLLDLSYGYEVTYPFEVVDWEGEGPWTGSITYTREEVRQISGQTEKSGVNGDQTSTLRITVTLGETEWESGDPSMGATTIMVKGTVRGEYSLRGRSRGWYKTDCWAHKGVILHSTMEEQMSGAGSGSANIAITVVPTNYSINVGSDDGFEAVGRAVGRGDQCKGGGITQVSTSQALGPMPLGLGIPMTFGRSLAAGDARNVLRGRLTDTQHHVDANNPGIRTTTTWTITWDIRRR